jgi:hypothetical protein
MEEHSPGLGDGIKNYNDVISEAVRDYPGRNIFLVNVYEEVKSMIIDIEKYVTAEDGHHLMLEGHKLYSDLLISREKKNKL